MDYIFYHFLHYSDMRFSFLLIILLGGYTLYLIKLVNKNSDYKNKNYFKLYEKLINILFGLHVLLSLIDFIRHKEFFYLILGGIGIAIICGLFYILSKNGISVAKPKEFYKIFFNHSDSTYEETTSENNNQPQITKSFKLDSEELKKRQSFDSSILNVMIAIGIIIGILFISWILWSILKSALENGSFSYYNFDYTSLLQFIPISIIAFIILIITFLTFIVMINSKLNILLKRECIIKENRENNNQLEDKINKVDDKNKNDTV